MVSWFPLLHNWLYLLSLFSLMLTLPNFWPMRASFHWLLCTFSEFSLFFEHLFSFLSNMIFQTHFLFFLDSALDQSFLYNGKRYLETKIMYYVCSLLWVICLPQSPVHGCLDFSTLSNDFRINYLGKVGKRIRSRRGGAISLNYFF